MSPAIRILLILCSLLFLVSVLKRIRKAKLQIEYAIFWVLLACVLVVLALFPQLASLAAVLLGVVSPVNLIFLVMIFILLVKVFFQTIEIAHLEYKLRELVQKMALDEAERRKRNQGDENVREVPSSTGK